MKGLRVFIPALCAAAIVAATGPAFATRDMSHNIVAASGGFQNLIATICWIAGFILVWRGVANLLRLWRMKSEDEGYDRRRRVCTAYLVAGIMLFAYPFLQRAVHDNQILQQHMRFYYQTESRGGFR